MKPLSLSRPHLIVMIGIPGSGKSTFAERFAEMFNTPLVSQLAFEQLLFGTKYDNAANEQKALILTQNVLGELLKTGQTIIYEDTTGSRLYRQDLAKTANKAGYVPLFVWVQTDSAEASRRALRKNKDSIALSHDQFDQAVARFTVPVSSEKAIVISGKHTFASQLKIVLKNLTTERAGRPVQVPHRSIKIQ